MVCRRPIRIVIERTDYLDDATLGVLTCGDFSCYTLELPWHNNADDVSCIPIGEYPAAVRKSNHNNRKLGYLVVWLSDVPDRDDIQIHIANRPLEIRGCIAVGLRVDKEQPAVLSSTDAMRALLDVVGVGRDLVVVVRDADYLRLSGPSSDMASSSM